MFKGIRVYFGGNITDRHILDTNLPWKDCSELNATEDSRWNTQPNNP